MNVIEIRNLTKNYKLGQLPSLKQTIGNLGRRMTGRAPLDREGFAALKEIDLCIEQGEIVGIIGVNGAGKSTLLKLIAKITEPSEGSVAVRGSIAPLIEVGAGLHPELTGRENIFLNSAILGIPRRVIQSKVDEIVDFAELQRFIDTPLKRYSSGMVVRLGFAIATSLDADILIVDEVLAVGDLAFQRKCFDRMETKIKNSGKTVLLVSHNIRQVERLCSRVALLDEGRIAMDGPANTVCSEFYQRSNAKIRQHVLSEQAANARVSSSGEVRVERIECLDEVGRAVDQVTSRGPLRIRVWFHLDRPLHKPEIIVGTHTTDFIYLSAGSTLILPDRPDLDAGDHEIEYILPSFPMAAGEYCIRFSLFDDNACPLFMGETLKTFSVVEPGGRYQSSQWWTLNLPTEWRLDGRRFVAPSYSCG